MNPLNQIQQTIAGFKNQTDLARQKLMQMVNKMPIAQALQGNFSGAGQQIASNYMKIGKDPMGDALNMPIAGSMGILNPSDEHVVQLGTKILDGLAKRYDVSGMGNALEMFSKMIGDNKIMTLKSKSGVRNAVENVITSPGYKKALEAVKNPLFKVTKL